jgi:hypothetical protein
MLVRRLSRRIAWVASGEDTGLGNGLGSALNAVKTDTPGSSPSVQQRCGPRHTPKCLRALSRSRRAGPFAHGSSA